MHFSRRPEFYAAPSRLLFALALSAATAAGAQQAKPLPAPDLPLTPPGLNPDESGDALLSLQGLPGTQSANTRDGLDLTQNFLGVAPGTGSNPSPDPDGDSDSAELQTGPASGLGRGRRAGVAYGFSVAAVREFRQGSPVYDARQAHLTTGIDSVSRSGDTIFHGSLSYGVRSSSLNAANPLAVATSYADGVVSSQPVKPDDLRQTFGATLGGPVPRARKLVFFYAFDAQRRNFPAISSPADPNFFRLTLSQRDLLLNRGVLNGPLNTALNYLSSLTGLAPRRADQTLNFGRLDWAPRPRLQLSAQYNEVRWSSPAGLTDAPVVARGRASLGSSNGSLDQVLVRFTARLRPTLVNEFTAQFTRDLQFGNAQGPLPQEPAGAVPGTSPEVVIGPNGFLFGTPASVAKPAYPDERQFALAESLTYRRAHHLFVAGATASFLHDTTATLANSAGTFRYDSSRTAVNLGGLVDFLTDFTFNANVLPNGACPAITAPVHLFCFNSFSQSFGLQTVAFATQIWAGFADEIWNPRPGLTLQAGLRYDYTLLPLPQFPNPSLDALFAARGATSIFPEDRNNFGPRASAAWEPLGPGRGTVRAGYGIFYGRLPGATIQAALADTAQAASTTRIRILPTTLGACPQVPGQPFGYPCSFPAQPGGTLAPTTSAVVFARNFRLPAIQQASLTLERNLPRATAVTVGYVLNLDRQLPTSTDLNLAPATRTATYTLQGGTGAPGVRTGETFSLPLYTARISPSFGPVTAIRSSANGTYHALELQAESRPVASVRLRAAYTWSKAIDYAPSLSATPRTDAQLDPYSNGYDKGLSSLNYPWAVNAAVAWSPHPVASFHHLLSNWDTTVLFADRAGRPYSLDLFGGPRLPGGHESLNGSGGALYLPTVGRNTLRLPARPHVTATLTRAVPLAHNRRLEARVEATNLLNQRQVEAVTQRAFLVGTTVAGVTPLVFQDAATIATEGLNTQPFGTPTATGSSLSRERQISFLLRFEF